MHRAYCMALLDILHLHAHGPPLGWHGVTRLSRPRMWETCTYRCYAAALYAKAIQASWGVLHLSSVTVRVPVEPKKSQCETMPYLVHRWMFVKLPGSCIPCSWYL